MSYKIISTFRFEKELKRLSNKFPSLKNEFTLMVANISNTPDTGISIGNNCYKIRLAIKSKGKGKRGGARVITYLYFQMKTVYLLTIYDKNEKADLKSNELNEMLENLDLGG